MRGSTLQPVCRAVLHSCAHIPLQPQGVFLSERNLPQEPDHRSEEDQEEADEASLRQLKDASCS